MSVEDAAEVLPAPEAADPTERSDRLRVIGQLEDRAGDIVRSIGLEGTSVQKTASKARHDRDGRRISRHRSMKRLAELPARMIE